MNTAYPTEITRVAITTDGSTAIAAYFASEAMFRATSFSPSAQSDAAIIADALATLPAPHRIATNAEFVVTRDPGDGSVISTTSTIPQ
ncbi:hypothetical protein [Agrobacterium tumefaciens]|uniref:hypothetical protein n=1 Tax=Agrobacterium tumefaciens TaxID=358 RepID=UPI0015749C77|nr:hypothetical protein [Agrobacterium tumefaciens]